MFDGDGGARYDVEVRLKKAGAGWDDLSDGASKFSGIIDGIAGKMGRLAAGGVFAAGATGVAAMTWGVTKLNAEAEGAAISIGTIFSVNGIAANVPAGITMAQEQIAKMRIDAQKLPGEFEDLQKIFMTGAIPMFQAGATADQARKLSAQVMAAGAVMGLQSDMTAREFGMLLSGRAGGHNVFGTRLGFAGARAKELNAADPAKRLQMVSAETQKYSGAIDIFAHSYEGLSSTLVDNVKNFGRLATAPLFGEAKDTLSDINDWFTANQERVNRWALILGNDLSFAFRTGKAAILEWWPLVSDFASKAIERVESIWESVKPGVQSFGDALKEALKDPNGTLDKLIHLAELAAGVSLAGHLAGGLGGALAKDSSGALTSGAKVARVTGGLELAGAGIAGALVGADGGKPAGQAVEAGSAVGGGAMAGSIFGPLGIAAGAAAGALGLVAAAAENYSSVKAASETQNAQAAWEFGRTLYETNSEINRWSAAHGQAEVSFHDALEAQAQGLEATGDAALQAEAALLRINEAAMEAAFALSAMASSAGDERANAIGDQATSDYGLGMMGEIKAFIGGANDAKAKPKMGGGHGGTSIQKVEIVVTSNQSPSRIARQVHSELAKLSNNRKISKYVPNWSALDEV